MDKVLQKIVRRGDEQGRTFAQKVLANAAVASKQKALDSKSLQTFDTQEATAKKAFLGSKTSLESSAAVKKSQVGGESGSLLPKKGTTALPSAATNGLSGSAKVGSLASRKLSSTDSKQSDKGATNTTAAKIKTNVVTPKATSFFSSLQSASKKPGTSNAALKSAKPKDSRDGYVVKPVLRRCLNSRSDQFDRSTPETKDAGVASAASKPSFSFAETMANLSKTKESAPLKSEESRAPETAEERRKRLRKEDRRKLRVSFKPDESLVQIRIFEHDPDEELGHDDSMVRDANDIKGEGQMLKMHREREVMDEDDEIDTADEILQPWTAPTCKPHSEFC